MKTLREQWFTPLQNEDVTAISFNGFQLKGKLTRYDCSDIALSTNQYGQKPKEVLCTNFIAVIPTAHLHQDVCYASSFSGTMRELYLHNLLFSSICCIVINGFRLKGTLIAYDEHDVIIATKQYGDMRHVLVTNFSAIYPEE